MPTSCPICGGKWPYGAILCTACGFDPAIHPDPRAVAAAEATKAAIAPRGRWDCVKSGWFLLILPNVLLPPLAALSPSERGRSRESYEYFLIGVYMVYGGGVLIAAAISSYLRTRDAEHSFFRPRFFAGAVVYAQMRFKLAILGYLISILLATWVYPPLSRLD